MSVRSDELDRMTDRDAAASLGAEFPGWTAYRAADRLCYARRDKPKKLVRGEDWADLRDQMIRELWQAAGKAYEAR